MAAQLVDTVRVGFAGERSRAWLDDEGMLR